MFVKITTLLTAILTFPFPAFAAVDGTLDPTSTGTFDLSITIPGRVNISDLNDLNLGTVQLKAGTVRTDDDICIYANTSSGLYDVTITGSGTAGAYTVTNGVDTIPFFVRYNDETGTLGNGLMTSGVTLTSRTGPNSESFTCATGGLTGNIEVIFTSISSASNGDYLGTLTVLIEPR